MAMLLYITFRLDDICPQMDREKFLAYQNLFDQYGIKPLIGIVPDNQDDYLKCQDDDPQFWDKMRKLQSEGWAIAQHGYQHVYCTQVQGLICRRPLSEFAGLPLDEQMEKISRGKRILAQEGLDTDIFMAPGHSYDETTLDALRECGFKYVTDGLSSWPYMLRGLKFIPCRNMSPLLLPGINTKCIHANSSDRKEFKRIQKALTKTRYTRDFREVLGVGCGNTYLSQKEERLYEAAHKYVIVPLILARQRMFRRAHAGS